MNSATIFNNIKRDRHYLLKLYIIDALLMIIASLIFANFRTSASTFSLTSLLYVVPGALTGLFTASMLHNTSHNNIQFTSLNRIIGEFCGYWVLYGYSNFVMIHLLHHANSDKEHDPVNPQGMNFLTFLSAPMRYMIKTTKSYLNKIHDQNADYAKIMKLQTFVFNLNLALRLGVWYALLGKELFFFFYLPGFFSNVIIYAHINFVCHRDHADGSVEIVNLNHNLYYKFANFITIGGYFHKNHHINPGLFDPRDLAQERAIKTVLTIQPQRQLTFSPAYKKNPVSAYFNIYDVWGEKKILPSSQS